jgi:hypothetical protein
MARCGTLSPQQYDKLFFPKSGRSILDAKQFCLGCPVKDQCLEVALADELEGIWAGTNMKEREGILAFQAQLSGTVTVPKTKVVKRLKITFL